jgi:hypothetical protein
LVCLGRNRSSAEEWANAGLLDFSKGLRLRVSLKALDDIKSGKQELVDSKLTKPIVFQMPARVHVELGMLFNKLVATIKFQAKERRGGVEDFCLLLAPVEQPARVRLKSASLMTNGLESGFGEILAPGVFLRCTTGPSRGTSRVRKGRQPL